MKYANLLRWLIHNEKRIRWLIRPEEEGYDLSDEAELIKKMRWTEVEEEKQSDLVEKFKRRAEDTKRFCERLAARMDNANNSEKDFSYTHGAEDAEADFYQTFKDMIDDLIKEYRIEDQTDSLHENQGSAYLDEHDNAQDQAHAVETVDQDTPDQKSAAPSEISDHQRFQHYLNLMFADVKHPLPSAEVTKEEWNDSPEMVTQIVNEQHPIYTDEVYDENATPLDKDFKKHRANFDYELKKQAESSKKNLKWHKDKLNRYEQDLVDKGGAKLAEGMTAFFGEETPEWVARHFIDYKPQENNKVPQTLYPPVIGKFRSRLICDEEIRSKVFSKMKSGYHSLMGMYKLCIENNITENAKDIARQVAHDIKQRQEEGLSSEEIVNDLRHLFWHFYYALFIYTLANARKFRVEFSDETNQKKYESENNSANASALHNKLIGRFSYEKFPKTKSKPQMNSNDSAPGLIDEKGWRTGKNQVELLQEIQDLESDLTKDEWFLITYKDIGGLTQAEAAAKLKISVPTLRLKEKDAFNKAREL
ncbi:hypothetical protein [Gimesia sp.]|uniref:hypothetical protein n=1 Tax=Gimesia sp. TaxID=2024833 RepID=UPI003A8EEF4F